MRRLSSAWVYLLWVCVCLAGPSYAEDDVQKKQKAIRIEKVTEGVPFATAGDDAAPPPRNALYRVLLDKVPLKEATDALGKEMDVKIHLPKGDLRNVKVSLDEKRIGLMAALTKITKGKFWGSRYTWGKTRYAEGTITSITYIAEDPSRK